MHAIGTQRIDAQRSHERRVDAARQTEQHAVEAVLVHVVAQSQLERGPQLGIAVLRQRRDLPRPTRHVAHHEILRAVDATRDQFTRRVVHQAAPVKRQLILATHEVRVADGDAVVAGEGSDERVALLALAEVVRRGREVDDQRRTVTRRGMRRAVRHPDVLADRQTHTLAGHVNDHGTVARDERALLVEHAVVRQRHLVEARLDLAVAQQVRGVAHARGARVRAADDDRDGQTDREFGNRCLARRHERRAQHEILGRIAADRKLRRDDQLGTLFGGTVDRSADQRGIAGEVADRRIKLGEREAHACSLLRFGRSASRLGQRHGDRCVERHGAVEAGRLGRLRAIGVDAVQNGNDTVA